MQHATNLTSTCKRVFVYCAYGIPWIRVDIRLCWRSMHPYFMTCIWIAPRVIETKIACTMKVIIIILVNEHTTYIHIYNGRNFGFCFNFSIHSLIWNGIRLIEAKNAHHTPFSSFCSCAYMYSNHRDEKKRISICCGCCNRIKSWRISCSTEPVWVSKIWFVQSI